MLKTGLGFQLKTLKCRNFVMLKLCLVETTCKCRSWSTANILWCGCKKESEEHEEHEESCMGHVFAQSIGRQQLILIAVPYRLQFMVWITAKASVKIYYYKHTLQRPLPEAIEYTNKGNFFSSGKAARAWNWPVTSI